MELQGKRLNPGLSSRSATPERRTLTVEAQAIMGNTDMFFQSCSSPVGPLTLASDGDRLIGLWLAGQKYYGSGRLEAMTEGDAPVLRAGRAWLDRYFAGEKPCPSELPLCPAGSEFRREVWSLLCDIPYGETTTYGAIAKKMAVRMGRESMGSQAVGGAVGHNPLSIIIPCHRVVGADGSLTGYAGGLDVKIKLLEGEGADMSRLHRPRKGTAL